MTPVFLTLAEVIELHGRMVDEFGGSPEVRDIGLLQSAIAMPMAQFGGQYLHAELASMAAAYMFHIVSNHPFVDGNKRAGAVAARVFLLVNDATFEPGEEEYGDLVVGVASGTLGKDDAIAFFQKHVR